MTESHLERSAVDALRQTPLSVGLSPSALTELALGLPVVDVAVGEVVMAAGAAADAAYVVLSGGLDVHAVDGALINRQGPGALIGEMALLPDGPGTRTATVTATVPTRLLRVDAALFSALLDEHAERRKQVEADSDTKTMRGIGARSDTLGLLLDRSERRAWSEGEVVFEEGDPPDGLHLVLAGRAEVVGDRDGEPVHFATVYPGRVFGELGILRDRPRSASVVARAGLRTAFVPAEQVRALGQQHPELEGFLGSLVRAYELPNRGRMEQRTVFREGWPCVQTVFHLDDGRRLTAVRGREGRFTLTLAGAEVARQHQVAAGTVVSLDADHRIVGIEDTGEYDDIAALQALALDGQPLSVHQRRALRRAAREVAQQAPDALICNCMGLKRATLQAAIADGATTQALLQDVTGCGTVCGGCMKKAIPAMLDGVAPVDVPALPVPTTARLPRLPHFVPWLGNFSFSRDPVGFQRRGHERLGPAFSAHLLGRDLVFVDPRARPDLLAEVCAAPKEALDVHAAWRLLVGDLLGGRLLAAHPDPGPALDGDRPRQAVAAVLGKGGVTDGPVDLGALAGEAAVAALGVSAEHASRVAAQLELLLGDLTVLGMLMPLSTPATRRRADARRRLEEALEVEQLAVLVAVVPTIRSAVVATLLDLLADRDTLNGVLATLDAGQAADPSGSATLHRALGTSIRSRLGGAIWRLARRPVGLGDVVVPEGALVGAALSLAEGGRPDGVASLFDERLGSRGPADGLAETTAALVLAQLLRGWSWTVVQAPARWTPPVLPGLARPRGVVRVTATPRDPGTAPHLHTYQDPLR